VATAQLAHLVAGFHNGLFDTFAGVVAFYSVAAHRQRKVSLLAFQLRQAERELAWTGELAALPGSIRPVFIRARISGATNTGNDLRIAGVVML
jgi:hypothetical protein